MEYKNICAFVQINPEDVNTYYCNYCNDVIQGVTIDDIRAMGRCEMCKSVIKQVITLDCTAKNDSDIILDVVKM